MKKYSFTLVELMIVLAILAILAGIAIFVLKPGFILDKFNDQRRIDETKSISKAIDYLNVIQLGLLNLGSATTIYTSLPDNTSTTCSSYTLPTLPSGYGYACKNSTVYKLNDGTGWIPINFRESDNSSLLATLPIDPVNNADYFYSYFPGGSYELVARLKNVHKESQACFSKNYFSTGSSNRTKLTPIYMPENSIINGDFSNGTLGWTAIYSTVSVSNGIYNAMINRNDVSRASVYQITSIPHEINRKVFVKIKARVTNNQSTLLSFYTGRGNGGFDSAVCSSIANPIENKWYICTGLVTIKASDNTDNLSVFTRHYYNNTSTAYQKSIQLNSVGILDLNALELTDRTPTELQTMTDGCRW